MFRVESFWTASVRGSVLGRGVGAPLLVVFVVLDEEASMCGARRWRQREKSGEGKTVRDFVRMDVTVSSRVRWGLNWYLIIEGN